MADRKLSRRIQPPNGGWGWMVVLGAALTNSFNHSLISIYGLVFGEKLTQMGENTVGVALVGNVMLLVMNFSGLISGPALKVYSPRSISIIASFFSATGMVLAGFATTRWHLLASYSVVTGFGLGLLQSSTFIAVDSYFTTRRGRAVGIAMAGTGLGQVALPHLVRYLLDNYEYKGTTLTLGILALNGIIGASLFRPLKRHAVREDSEKRRLIDDPKFSEDNADLEVETSLTNDVLSEPLNLDDPKDQITTVNNRVDYEEVAVDGRSNIGCMEKVKRFFDLDLLLDFTFVNIMIGCCLGFTSLHNFNILFPFFLQQEVGMNRNQTAMCMSVLSAADIVGRLTIPVIIEKCNTSSRGSFYIGCVALAITRTALSLQNEYFHLIFASAVTGVFKSCLVVNQNLVISEHFEKGNPKLSTAIGITMITRGISIITVGQVLGWVRDYYASYVVCFFAQNVLLIIVFMIWSLEYIYKFCCK